MANFTHKDVKITLNDAGKFTFTIDGKPRTAASLDAAKKVINEKASFERFDVYYSGFLMSHPDGSVVLNIEGHKLYEFTVKAEVAAGRGWRKTAAYLTTTGITIEARQCHALTQATIDQWTAVIKARNFERAETNRLRVATRAAEKALIVLEPK